MATESKNYTQDENAGRSRVYSSARHLAMVACILIGVFVYAGWKVQQRHKISAAQHQNPQNGFAQGMTSHSSESNAPLQSSVSFDGNTSIESFALPGSATAPASSNTQRVLHIKSTPIRDTIPTTAPALDEPPLTVPVQPPLSTMDVPEPSSQIIGGRRSTQNPAPVIDEREDDNVSQPLTAAVTITLPTVSQPAIEPDTDPEMAMLKTATSGYCPVYTVRAGDTLNRIAEDILGDRNKARDIFNNNRDLMESPNQLQIGMKLKMPGAADAPKIIIHTITKSDSLPSLAVRYYGDSSSLYINHIRNTNPILQKDGFQVGMRLIIPPLQQQANTNPTSATSTAEVQDSSSKYYIVKSGDTLSRIAQTVYANPGRWSEIYNANKETLPSPNQLQVGMKLRLP